MFRAGVGACPARGSTRRLTNPQAMTAVSDEGVVKKPNTRSVTDIPYYKRVEYSHLHDAGQKSEKTRFLEKIKKLEEAAEIKAKMGTVGEVHRAVEKPPGWKPAKIPNRIDKDPTSVLKAMASVVGKDHTGPAYQYHDDPYLIPYNSLQKKTYLLAKDSGRKAARYILDQHPELFTKNLIEMVPKIKRYMPRVQVTLKSANLELLENYVQSFNVAQAVETFKFLEEKGEADQVDTTLKQKLLELVCYHNASPEPDEDSFRELWGTVDQEQQLEELAGFAEKLVDEITSSDEATDAEKLNARVALASAYANHTDEGNVDTRHRYVLDVYEELSNSGGDIELNVFNNVILSHANASRIASTRSSEEIINKVNQILHDMKEKQVKPDVQTLCNYLKVTNSLAFNKSIKGKQHLENTAKSVLAEFRDNLGVEPSLGCYHYYVLSHQRSKIKTAILDVVQVLENEKIRPVLKEDFLFFNGAIKELVFVNKRRDQDHDFEPAAQVPLDYFYKLHRLVVANEVLLGDIDSSFRYYNTLLLKVVESDKIDTAMDLWEQIVPHTLAPSNKVIMAVIQLIPAKDGWKHLPRIWSDMLASNFNNSRMGEKFKLFSAMMDTLNQSDLMEPAARVSGEDHAMFQHFVAITQAISEIFLKDTTTGLRFITDRRREDMKALISDPGIIKFVNQSLCIISNKMLVFDELVTADMDSQCRLVDFVVHNDADLSGTLAPEPLKMALDNCLLDKNTGEALKIVRYAAQNQLGSAIDLATSLVKSDSVQLTEAERAQINSLFSYETKWVPV